MLLLTRHQCSIHCEGSHVDHGWAQSSGDGRWMPLVTLWRRTKASLNATEIACCSLIKGEKQLSFDVYRKMKKGKFSFQEQSLQNVFGYCFINLYNVQTKHTSKLLRNVNIVWVVHSGFANNLPSFSTFFQILSHSKRCWFAKVFIDTWLATCLTCEKANTPFLNGMFWVVWISYNTPSAVIIMMHYKSKF